MTLIARLIEAFLHNTLSHHRGARQHTCDSYAYSFQLLFEFAAARLKIRPSSLVLEQLDSETVSTFLQHLEETRQNAPETRNVRLAAIKSFFHSLNTSIRHQFAFMARDGESERSLCGRVRPQRCALGWRCAARSPRQRCSVNLRGQPMSRWGVAHMLKQHAKTAGQRCPGLLSKKLSPHVLRHYLPSRMMSGASEASVDR
jgi:site-specific recombinase XerD